MPKAAAFAAFLALFAAAASAQRVTCEEEPFPIESPPAPLHPILERVLRYGDIETKHRVAGLASYYSAFFDGRKTANGEIFRNRKYSAAHRTLPMGSWIEVRSRATGRKLRMRVNDRGPFVNKFAIDLSRAAARYLGVDIARDRYVEFRIVALPGEEPLPEDEEEKGTR